MAEEQPWHSRAWAWLKKWGGLLFGSILFVTLALFGAGWAWRRRGQLLGQARDEAAVAEARLRMDALRSAREEVARQRGEEDVRIKEIDAEIAITRRHIIALHEGGESLVDEDLERAAAELGL